MKDMQESTIRIYLLYKGDKFVHDTCVVSSEYTTNATLKISD